MTPPSAIRTIEVRSSSPASLWQAIAPGELDGGLAVERRVLAPGATLPPASTMVHFWLAQGSAVLVSSMESNRSLRATW